MRRTISTTIILSIITTIILGTMTFDSHAYNIREDQNIRAIIGEASNQGYQGMLAVACGIRNRGTLKGVYGVNAKHIDNEPNYIWKLAEKSWIESEHNRIHSGTHWENIKAFGKPYWAESMVEVYRYKDHVFYKESR